MHRTDLTTFLPFLPEGWGGFDKDAIGNLRWFEYEPKKWDETDVDIKIQYCGICASDLHTLSNVWVRALPALSALVQVPSC